MLIDISNLVDSELAENSLVVDSDRHNRLFAVNTHFFESGPLKLENIAQFLAFLSLGFFQ